jgi:uncharacterized membrane protein HdeD (DUF308 family)
MAHLYNYKKMQHDDTWNLLCGILGMIVGTAHFLLHVPTELVQYSTVLIVAFLSGASGVAGKMAFQAASKALKEWLNKRKHGAD